MRAALRGSELTKSLLVFSRESAGANLSLDINSILREMDQLIERSLTPEVTVKMDLAPLL